MTATLSPLSPPILLKYGKTVDFMTMRDIIVVVVKFHLKKLKQQFFIKQSTFKQIKHVLTVLCFQKILEQKQIFKIKTK